MNRMPKDIRTRLVAPFLLAAALLMGCSNTAYLPEGEMLYLGSNLTIESEGDVPNEGGVEDDLELTMKPEPNDKLFGLFRFKLWLYNMGLETLGEPPVLFSAVSPDITAAAMRNILINWGFFDGEVSYAVDKAEKTAEVDYMVRVKPPHTIRYVTVAGDSSMLMQRIHYSMTESELAPGEPYSLAQLKAERDRIDGVLKDEGYFYFGPDYLIFEVDSTVGNRQVDLTLKLKDQVPPEAKKVYVMNDVTVFAGYSLDRDSAMVNADTTRIDSYNYIDADKRFDPRVILGSVYLKPGEIYARRNHNLTLSRLMNLGVFKFVNVRFKDVTPPGAQTGSLNCTVYLTPVLMKTIRLELQAVSKSNNLAGPVFESSFRNRNFLSGAEIFILKLNGSFEIPVSGKQSGLNSYEVGASTELQVPKFITPFPVHTASGFVPKTRFMIGVDLLSRIQYFNLTSLNFTFGYQWKESLTKSHELNPLSMTISHLSRTTEKFDKLISNNPILRRSFEEQFILGPNYAFTYNDQLIAEKKNHVYFNGTIDLSGNLLYLMGKMFGKGTPTEESPFRVFGVPFSQYSRFAVDLRHYLNSADNTTTLASRIVGGIGVPYGNSTSLPYFKQFFIGGTNSIRAFDARQLGPGSYKTPDSLAENAFVDQSGDIKFEMNMEYRFPIVSILKGALFVDAGNIWLLHDDPQKPGGTFHLSSFLDQLAVGSGFGLRLDISFVVLRFDLAWPLRKPYLAESNRWVIDQIRFWNPDWRKDNLVLNIAIGYPY